MARLSIQFETKFFYSKLNFSIQITILAKLSVAYCSVYYWPHFMKPVQSIHEGGGQAMRLTVNQLITLVFGQFLAFVCWKKLNSENMSLF